MRLSHKGMPCRVMRLLAAGMLSDRPLPPLLPPVMPAGQLLQRLGAGAGSLVTLYSRTLAPNLSTLPTFSCLATCERGEGRSEGRGRGRVGARHDGARKGWLAQCTCTSAG